MVDMILHCALLIGIIPMLNLPPGASFLKISVKKWETCLKVS